VYVCVWVKVAQSVYIFMAGYLTKQRASFTYTHTHSIKDVSVCFTDWCPASLRNGFRDSISLAAKRPVLKHRDSFTFTFYPSHKEVKMLSKTVFQFSSIIEALKLYSLTKSIPWSRVLLEKLIVTQLVKLPAFYGTRRFITMLTRARHWSPSWARCIQSTLPHPTSVWFV
jgi:hypothetical protein